MRVSERRQIFMTYYLGINCVKIRKGSDSSDHHAVFNYALSMSLPAWLVHLLKLSPDGRDGSNFPSFETIHAACIPTNGMAN